MAIFPFTPVELASWKWESVSAVAWIAVAYMAFVSTALGYGVWHWGISRLGADRVLIYQYLITLTGVVSSIIVLREGFGFTKVLGAVVLLAGVYLAHRRKEQASISRAFRASLEGLLNGASSARFPGRLCSDLPIHPTS